MAFGLLLGGSRILISIETFGRMFFGWEMHWRNIFLTHCRFVLSVLFRHRWLHKCLVIKESMTRPTRLVYPILWIFGTKGFIFCTVCYIVISLVTYCCNNNSSSCIKENDLQKFKAYSKSGEISESFEIDS